MADVSVTFGAKDVGLKATMKALSDELDSLTRKAKQSEMGFVELKTTLGRMNEIKKVQNDLRSLGDEATKTAAKTKGIGAAFGALKGGLAAVGIGVGFGAIISQSKQIIADFARIQDLAERFNTSAESIQRLANAARLGGTDIDTVATALTKAGMAATDVVTGNEAMAQTFERAGINARSFLDADIDQKLLLVSEAFQKANGDAIKVNSIIEILGTRGGANLIPLISKIDDLRSNMNGAAVATDETVKRLAEADDKLETFGNNLKIYAADVLSFLDKQGEKIGNFFAGKGSKLDEELKNLEEAEKRLAARGITRPELERQRVMIPTPMGAVPAERDAPGVRAAEFEKQLVAEVAKMKQESLENEKKKRNEILELQKQQQEEARRQAEIEKRITEENEAQARARARIAEDMLAAESRVAAQAAEDERRSLAESLNLELQIAEAKKSGNAETLKQLESEKKRVENQKKFNDLVSQFMKAGEAFGPASSKASRMIAAQAEPETPVVRGDGGARGGFQGRTPELNIGGQMRQSAQEALAQQRLLGGRGEQFQALMGQGKFSQAARLAAGIERKAERQQQRQEIESLGGELEKRLKSNIGVFGARTAEEKGLGGRTAREFSKMTATQQAQELGISSVGKSMKELRDEINKQLKDIKKAGEGMPKPSGGDGAEGETQGAGAGGGGQDPIEKILEQVTAIKDFIDKKLPMQALAT